MALLHGPSPAHPPNREATIPKYLSTSDECSTFLDSYDTFMFDCDGVIWTGPKGDELTPHIESTIALLRQKGKDLAFITNNATRSRRAYLTQFHSLGLNSVTLSEIFTCGSASASYLAERVLPMKPPHQKGVYVIGQKSLEEELAEVGLTWTGGTDPEDDVLLPDQDFSSITPDPSIGIVLFSFQMRWNYKQFAKAYNYLATNPGCDLILTNSDSTVMIPGGVAPGEGAMAACLYGARHGLEPTIVGKPYQPLLDIVHKALQYDPTRTIMVGDRLETDILFGKRGKLATLLVLTGSSTESDLVHWPPADQPDYIAACVGSLMAADGHTMTTASVVHAIA